MAIHKQLASGRWQKLTLLEQMANIGSEVERALSWRRKGNLQYSQQAFWRALELFDLTLAVQKGKIKEIARAREVVADYFAGDNNFNSSEQSLRAYFYPFFYGARINT